MTTGYPSLVQLSKVALYSVGREGGGVAGMVTLSGTTITWFAAGGRQRAYDIARQLPARRGVAFAFVDSRGRAFELRPLTLREYNRNVRLPGQPWIRTTRELRAAYRRSLRT